MMTKMSREIQVWFRAMLMRVICRNIHMLYWDTGITCMGDMGEGGRW